MTNADRAHPNDIEVVPGENGSFLDDVVDGLAASPKRLPSKHLYDKRGSELFEDICELDEYYVTRTELAIMNEHVEEMAEALGPHVLLIEPGSGASVKVRFLLEHLPEVAGYVPVDISGEHLERWAHLLRQAVPDLRIQPVHADFCAPFDVPAAAPDARRVIYFPGSTIGNFQPEDAVAWLAQMATLAGPGGALLIGTDRKKDPAILEAAYNDRRGVTREFNLNLLERMRDELDADVDVDRFEHRAFFNDAESRVEMHLVSACDQEIRVNGSAVTFEAGETIHTENSYKYDAARFRGLLERAGWRDETHWTDDDGYFAVHYCVVA